MLDKLTQRLDFHGNALLLRAERQRTIASNIANADTPGYVARDFKFADAMRAAQRLQTPGGMRQQSVSDARHMPLPAAASSSADSTLGYHPGRPRQARLCRADPAQPGQQHGGHG